ncbi:hypothetical protein ACFFGV_03750 [Pontibacillus salicampi]|uniref:DUF2273 domain-containing protein n=1 Tax=Pontibacillus salicampi TaxID=1449801 RepID=A0ABV6LJY2_9BACI
MFLAFLIVTGCIIGFLLLSLHELGSIIGFGIIFGCLVRIIYLLKELSTQLKRVE